MAEYITYGPGTYGVWPDAFAFSNWTYGTYLSYTGWFYYGILIGTHVANDPIIAFNSWINTTYNVDQWVSYNCNLPTTYADDTALLYISTYATSYNITYAALYYANVYDNVRALTWI